jgi:hypothetical protein
VDSKWHANYHTLRCWLDTEGGSWHLLKQYHWQQQQRLLLEDLIEIDEAAMMQQQEQVQRAVTATHAPEQQQQQQQQQQAEVELPPAIQEAYSWLLRQVHLYQKLKLTQLKVTLLRQLGEYG